jgi:hypothetical protein
MQISDRSVQLLHEVAAPFEAVDAVIERVVRFYREHCNGDAADVPKQPRAMPPGVMDLNPDAPPDLRHTRIVKAVFGHDELRGVNWNELVRKVIEAAYTAADRDFAKLRRMTSANMVEGHKTEDGYAPLTHLGISVQGVAANDAFRIVRELSKKMSTALHIIFEWRDKEGATHPGEAGQFVWKP